MRFSKTAAATFETQEGKLAKLCEQCTAQEESMKAAKVRHMTAQAMHKEALANYMQATGALAEVTEGMDTEGGTAQEAEGTEQRVEGLQNMLELGLQGVPRTRLPSTSPTSRACRTGRRQ